MTHAEFDRVYEEMLKEEADIMLKKGRDYTRLDVDKLANFKRISKKYDVSILKVIAIFYEKHADALVTFVNTEKLSGEPVYSKIQDMRNYLALMFAAIVEKEKK